MSSSWPLFTWLLLAQAGAMLALAAWSWRHRAAPGALAFAGLLLSVAVYVGFFALELPTTDVKVLLWVGIVEYLGICFIPPGVLATYSAVSGFTRWLTPWVRFGLLAFSALCAAVKIADPWWGAIYRTLSLDRQHGFTIATFDTGPWYYVVVSYLEASFLAGFLLAFFAWRKAGGLRRRQLTAMMLGAAFPWAAHLVYLSGLSPWGRLDFVPFAIFGTAVVMAWAIFREQLIAVTPIARDFVVDHLQDSVVVLDAHQVVVDFNPAAARMLGLTAADWGRPARAVLAPWPELSSLCGASTGKACDVRPVARGETCWQANWHPLSDRRGRHRGFVLTLGDVTERKRNERELEELLAARTAAWCEASVTALHVIETEQERLAQTIQDTICTDLSAVAQKITDAAGQMREHRLESLAARLNELSASVTACSRKARDLSHLIGDSDPGEGGAGLRGTLQQIQESTGMNCTLHDEGAYPVLDADRDRHLRRIVREAALNAFRHGRARQFWIECASSGGVSTLSISNDGTTLPPEEKRGRGLGLRLMRLRADLIGAQFGIRARAPFGTVVDLTFPSGPRNGASSR